MNKVPSLKNLVWPVENKELIRLLPMALLILSIIFVYSILGTSKNLLIVKFFTPKMIDNIKLLSIFFTVIVLLLYIKLCHNLSNQITIFFTISIVFVLWTVIFAYILFPNREYLNISLERLNLLNTSYPALKGFIDCLADWVIVTYYLMAELWGMLMITLGFWQIANLITSTEDAKRFYPIYIFIGGIGSLLGNEVISYFINDVKNTLSDSIKYISLSLGLASSFIIFLQYKIFKNLKEGSDSNKSYNLLSERWYKLSLINSIKLVVKSRYLKFLTLMIWSSYISFNLIDNIWKTKIVKLYPTPLEYTKFMSSFQIWERAFYIISFIISINILRKLSWYKSSIIVPITVLLSGLTFFASVIFENNLTRYLAEAFSYQSLFIITMVGTIYHLLIGGIKHQIFNVNKEIAYITLDEELKIKGKAIVDIVAIPIGIMLGNIIPVTYFIVYPSHSFDEGIYYFTTVFILVIFIWIYSLKELNKMHRSLINKNI